MGVINALQSSQLSKTISQLITRNSNTDYSPED
jgi:hypothetical protein